jgi:solute carrier family 25 (mitochondrial phosphate transporter), member 3
MILLTRAVIATAFVTRQARSPLRSMRSINRKQTRHLVSSISRPLIQFDRPIVRRIALGLPTTADAQQGNNATQVAKWEEVLTSHTHDANENTPDVLQHTEVTAQDKRILALTLSAAVFVFAGLVKASGRGSWRFYLAGGLCAAISHTIPVPIDVVKTRKQVDPSYQDMHVWDAAKRMVETEGLKSLLAGLGPTTFGYLFEGAVKFGVYEVLKPTVRTILGSIASSFSALAFLNTQLIAFMTCGAVSGVAAAIVLTPMEGLRIRMVAEPDFAPTGWVQGAYRMFKEEGAAFLVKGVKPMMYKQVPYTVTKNVAFDFFAKHAYASLRENGVTPTAAIKFTVPLVAAATASVLSCITSQPGDMLLSLMNAHGGARRTRDIVRDILRSERGVSGFFAGFKTRIVHVGLIVTLQLLLYDMIKRLCGIAATGLA